MNTVKHTYRLTTTIMAFGLCLTAQLWSQNIDMDTTLPETAQIRKGTLENGMTYYIGKTNIVQDVASYYIIQNVGSVLENDDQQGLAHFLEHMAFNGTENFKGKGILETLQKQGIVFGKDINAYTSFDETVYNIDNVPTTPEMVDTGLLILRDWSNYLLLTDEEIDAERGVIKEEWRTRQSGGMRILQQQLPVLFNNTIYSKRLPIGKMDVIDNFEYKVLRDFYHDWYRTDLQAIAVVGDVDVDAMEQKIRAMFSEIPAVENPKERVVTSIPSNDGMLYGLAMDEEVTTAKITFGIRHNKPLKEQTVGDLRTILIDQMITSMLSTRFKEISQDPGSPFLGVRIGYGDHSRATNALTLDINPKPDQQQEACGKAITELYRAVKFGYTTEEIGRTIDQFKNYYENAISKEGKVSHRELIRNIQQDFLEKETMTDVVREYELAKAIFENLTQETIHEAIKRLYTKENRYVLVTGVKGHSNLSEREATEIIDGIEKDETLEPYQDKMQGKTLLSSEGIKKGSIVSEYTSQQLNATTFTLSNGIRVHYKFADKNKNDVQLKAISDGGLSMVADRDLPSADMVRNTMDFSGLGDYSATDLSKLLAGKTASASIYLSDITEGISGKSSTKDVETMLQMVYLRFVHPRFDEEAFKVLIGNVDNYVVRRSNNINEKIKDSTTVTIYGNNNPKKRIFDRTYVKDISFNTIKRIYEERFANPADFQFFIVGDVAIGELRPLLETYLASIPTNGESEKWKDNSVAWVDKAIDRDVYMAMEDPKSTVRIGYKNKMNHNLKNEWVTRAMGDILLLRFTETLREQEGGTYGASVSAFLSKKPVEKASISVAFDCNPEKVEQLVVIVHREMDKLKKGDIQQFDLDKTLSNYIKERKEEQDGNGYDMRLLTDYFLDGYDRSDPKNFEDIVNAITIKDIQELAMKLLSNADTYEIVFKPMND